MFIMIELQDIYRFEQTTLIDLQCHFFNVEFSQKEAKAQS